MFFACLLVFCRYDVKALLTCLVPKLNAVQLRRIMAYLLTLSQQLGMASDEPVSLRQVVIALRAVPATSGLGTHRITFMGASPLPRVAALRGAGGSSSSSSSLSSAASQSPSDAAPPPPPSQQQQQQQYRPSPLQPAPPPPPHKATFSGVSFAPAAASGLRTESAFQQRSAASASPAVPQRRLEEFRHGSAAYLLDPLANSLYHPPSGRDDVRWPRYYGRLGMDGSPVPGERMRLVNLFARLDKYLKLNSVGFVNLFREADADGSGKLGPRELEALVSRMLGAPRDRLPELAYCRCMLDADSDGRISAEEFRRAVADWHESEMKATRYHASQEVTSFSLSNFLETV